ncbi:hypothetical protein ACW7G2_13540 [Luteimonas sp. A277]
MAGAEAQAGFYYQNLVGALHLLDLLEVGSTTVQVTLENPDRAKYIDDIIVDTTSGSTFIQVKWAADADASFTLAGLLVEEEGVSLWGKLARGYRQISSESGTKVVELLSTRRAGVNKQTSSGFPHSLQQFITEYHEPFIRSNTQGLNAVASYPDYKNTLEVLRKGAGFDEASEFDDFLKRLRFTLAHGDRDVLVTRVKARLKQLGIEQQQFGTLLSECVKWSISGGPVTAKDMQKALGLEDRFAERLSHRFPVDEKLWVEMPELFSALDNTLQKLPGGFVAVIGEPGAGKSTALTQYLHASGNIRFGYYCFIPDEQTLGNERLQEEAFVRSICARLRDAFPDFKFPTAYARPSVDLLNAWLHALSDSKERIVFLIDGLDHVDRQSRRSLLSKPLTRVLDGRVPDNVLIVLTTRYEEAIPPTIALHLQRDPARTIRVKRFDEAQVRKFMRLRGVSLTDALSEKVIRVSAGVPIYLEYLSGVLLPMSNWERERYLADAPTLRDGKIDLFHRHLWDEWSGDVNTTYVLAILAVREEYTSLEVLQALLRAVGQIQSLGEVAKTLKPLRYVLRVSEAKGYAIHHASLAEFVSERTSPHRREIFQAILAWYQSKPETDEAWRNRLRLLFELGRFAEAMDACGDEWVNRAWACYRPLSEIQANLNIAWQASVESNDLLSFTRVGFLIQQAGLIAQNIDFDAVDVPTVLLDLGLSDVALNMVWNGERLLVSREKFAAFAEHYAARLGRSLPAAMVREALADRSRGKYDALTSIYRVRSEVMDPEVLLDEIRYLRWHSKSERGHSIRSSDEVENDRLNSSLLLEIFKHLASRGAVDQIYRMIDAPALPATLHAAANAALSVALACADAAAESAQVIRTHGLSDLPQDYLGWVQVELALQQVPFNPVQSVELPKIPSLLQKNHRFNSELEAAFSHFRVFMLNLPDAPKLLRSAAIELQGTVADLVSASLSLAEFWVNQSRLDRKSGDFVTLQRICDRLAAPLKYASGDGGYDHDRHVYLASVHLLFQHVWDCAQALLSSDAHTALARQWLRSDRSSRFPAATRGLAISLSMIDSSEAGAIRRELLVHVEASARLEEETATLTTELLGAARAWGVCGFRAEGIRLWNEVALVACGVYSRKDYQFSEILFSLEVAHRTDPAGSLHRIREQFELSHQLEGTGAGKQVAIALEGLLELVARWYPNKVFHGLISEDPYIARERALRSVLGVLAADRLTDKRLLLAVLKTMSRWENYRHFNEDTEPAMREFFLALLKQGDVDVGLETYQFARQVFLVEKEMPHLVGQWANLWEGPSRPEAVTSDKSEFLKPTDTTEVVAQEQKGALASAFSDQVSPDLHELNSKLDALAIGARRERNSRELLNGRNDLLKAFLVTGAMDEVPAQHQTAVDELLEKFDQRVLEIMDDTADGLQAQVEDVGQATVAEFVEIVGGSQADRKLKDAFDVDAWWEQLYRLGGLGFEAENELKELLPGWVRGAAYKDLDSWLEFGRSRLSSEVLARLLIELAKRIKVPRRLEAFSLLEEARDCIADFFFEYTELSHEIAELAMELEPLAGRKLTLNGFIHHLGRYPTSLIFMLPRLIRLMGEVGVDGVELYRIWTTHNRRLIAGLAPKETDARWLDVPRDDVDDEVLRYLISLFQYPEVDIRLLSVEAVVELLAARPSLISTVRAQWLEFTGAGTREYLVSVFHSLNAIRPDLREEWAHWLVQSTESEAHLNIRLSVASAVCECVKVDPACEKAQRALDAPHVLRPLAPTLYGSQQDGTSLPPYPQWMAELFSDGATDEEVFEGEISRVLHEKYPNASMGLENDSVIHRRHNINTNFDNLEISPPFAEACREAINRGIVSLINAHEIGPAYVMGTADVLRLRDPTDSLVRIVSRPERIEWLSFAESQDDFLNFRDSDQAIANALRSRDGFTRLFEYSEQRGIERDSDHSSRVCAARVELFGVHQLGRALTEKDMLSQIGWLDNSFRNFYRTEIARRAVPQEGALVPLVAVSRRQFRGRSGGEIAALSSFWNDAIPAANFQDQFGSNDSDDAVLGNVIEWKSAFDQDRRLHEPMSSGSLLEVDTALLKEFAKRHSLDIFANVRLRRTTDKYKPEFGMMWRNLAKVVRVC